MKNGKLWTRFLVPDLSAGELLPILLVATLGAIVAGVYGVVHDQITYTIGPEYFTNFKFPQFNFSGEGNPRVTVAAIGFLSTWWVGLLFAWFLARRSIPNQKRSDAYQKIAMGFGIVLGCGLVSAISVYGYCLWCGPNADYSAWRPYLWPIRVKDTFAFVCVAYIHNASYAGGAIGFILAMAVVRPTTARDNAEAS